MPLVKQKASQNFKKIQFDNNMLSLTNTTDYMQKMLWLSVSCKKFLLPVLENVSEQPLWQSYDNYYIDILRQ